MQPHNHVCEPIATVDGHVAYSCRTCGQVAPPTVASALTATKSYFDPRERRGNDHGGRGSHRHPFPFPFRDGEPRPRCWFELGERRS